MGKGWWILGISLVFVLVLILFLFFFYVLYKPDNSKLYEESIASGQLSNPVVNKSLDESLSNFDDSYLFYLLYMLKAYDLRNPPLSSENPKIALSLGDSKYYSTIIGGKINVYPGETTGEDVYISTTKEEIIFMLQDEDYIQESFNSGKSQLKLVASKSKLFSKGYLNLYTEATGKSITGNVVRIYVA